jgi:hypothetical protein
MSQQDKGKQSKNNPRVIKCVQNIHNRITKCLKINKAKHQINSNILSHGCIIIIITTRQMIVIETFLDVQQALLHTEVNKVNLLLHRTHAPLERCQGSQNLSIACIMLWRRRSSMRRGCYIRHLNMNRRRLRSFIMIFTP